MEADLDKAEVVKATREELSGEKLLSTEYLGVSIAKQLVTKSNQDFGNG